MADVMPSKAIVPNGQAEEKRAASGVFSAHKIARRMSAKKKEASDPAHEKTQREIKLNKLIKLYDIDGNGQFSLNEVHCIFDDLEMHKSNAARNAKVAAALFAAVFLMIGAMFLVVYLGNEATKENHTKGNVLVGIDGGAVQTGQLESYTTLWDLAKMTPANLSDMKQITLNIDMASVAGISGIAEATFEVSGAWKPAKSKTAVYIATPAGFTVYLNTATETATITMGASGTFDLSMPQILIPATSGRRLTASLFRGGEGEAEADQGVIHRLSKADFFQQAKAQQLEEHEEHQRRRLDAAGGTNPVKVPENTECRKCKENCEKTPVSLAKTTCLADCWTPAADKEGKDGACVGQSPSRRIDLSSVHRYCPKPMDACLFDLKCKQELPKFLAASPTDPFAPKSRLLQNLKACDDSNKPTRPESFGKPQTLDPNVVPSACDMCIVKGIIILIIICFLFL